MLAVSVLLPDDVRHIDHINLPLTFLVHRIDAELASISTPARAEVAAVLFRQLGISVEAPQVDAPPCFHVEQKQDALVRFRVWIRVRHQPALVGGRESHVTVLAQHSLADDLHSTVWRVVIQVVVDFPGVRPPNDDLVVIAFRMDVVLASGSAVHRQVADSHTSSRGAIAGLPPDAYRCSEVFVIMEPGDAPSPIWHAVLVTTALPGRTSGSRVGRARVAVRT